MKTGKCPKCGNTNIYTNRGKTLNYGDRSGIHVYGFSGMWSEIYVCSNCRFFEEYISDNDDLEKMKKKWQKL